MTSAPCAPAGFATGALIGVLLQLWMYAIASCCKTVPTPGEAMLAGIVFATFAAAVLALLYALHARVRFRATFVPMLIVALLTGIAGGLLVRVVTPTVVVMLMCALLGYLLGLLACALCGSSGINIKGQGR